MPPISLIGLPGSGKSTVGRRLAQRLGLKFVDSDHIIERRIGCSIREYFEREGEDSFRDIEQQVIDELTKRPDCVLATGGGAVLRSVNRCYLRERGQVVYLFATPQTLFERLKSDQARPLLQATDLITKLTDLYQVRDPLYRETAHIVMDAQSATFSVVNLIAAQIELSAIQELNN